MLADMGKDARQAMPDTATLKKSTLGKIDASVAFISVALTSVALTSVALSGCATLRNALNFEEPQIQLQEIHVTGMGFSGGTLDLVFDVYNPNQYRLRSTRLDVGLELASTDFGDALIDKPLDLSPQNHSRVVMPVRFTWAGV